MRILFFNRSFYPDPASTGQLLTELCEDLVAVHGHEVTVIAAPVRGQRTRREGYGLFAFPESYHGVRILRTRSTKFAKTSFAGRACNYITYFVCALLTGWFERRPAIVVTYTDPPIAGLAAWLRARVRRARFVLVCQDIFPQVAVLLEGFRKGLVYELLDWVSWFLLYTADAIVAIGETMRRRLVSVKKARPEKIRVIHNWADCSAIVPGPKDNEFAQAHGLADKFVVMHSGNVGLSQSLETLVEAAVHLREFSDIMIVIVGEGAKKAELQKKVEDTGLPNVRFLPYQPKETLDQSFAAADVFVVSLKKGMEGYIVPSKVYGILAAGRPFVAAVSEECEAAVIADKYECGLVARPGDALDLADKILTLYRDREWCVWRGTRAREAALNYDRKAAASRYQEMFEELTKGRRSELDRTTKIRKNEKTEVSELDKTTDIRRRGEGK